MTESIDVLENQVKRFSFQLDKMMNTLDNYIEGQCESLGISGQERPNNAALAFVNDFPSEVSQLHQQYQDLKETRNKVYKQINDDIQKVRDKMESSA